MILVKIGFYLYILTLAFTSSEVVRDRKILDIIQDCTSAYKVKADEWLEWTNNKNATENVLCSLRCAHQKEGSLGQDGKWNLEYLEQKLSQMLLMKNSLRAQVLECISKLPPVQKCAEMLAADKCVTEVQFRNCSAEFNITKEDIRQYRSNTKEPTVKMLCNLKCSAENDDVIATDGTINIDLLNKMIDGSRFMSEVEKENVKKCYSEVQSMETCENYKPFHLCSRNMKL